MKRCIIIVVLLMPATALWAQPWQWQRLETDFYSPTGFPERIRGEQFMGLMIAIGDFNGDGRAEYYDVSEARYRVAVRDANTFHWTTSDYPGQGRAGVTGLWAADLDHDGQDELIVFADSVTVLKAVSYSPWTWETRNNLLAGLYLPPHVQKAIFGDYDGDGLLNAVVWTRADTDRVDILHRTAQGIWTEDSTLHLDAYSHGYVLDIFDGDFDHDGRMDFGVSYSIGAISEKDALMFFQNTGGGSVRHDFCITCSSFAAGGDLDGDGQWEELECDFYWGEGSTAGRFGYYLRHTAATDTSFIRFSDERYLGRFSGKLLGNFRTAHGPETVGIFNRWYSRSDMEYFECELEAYSLTGWAGSQVVHLYGGFLSEDHLFSASVADLDGDGRKDIVGILGSDDYGDLVVLPNTGTDSTDSFAYGDRISILPNAFPDNADTVFSSPQVGTISGDSRAELAVLAMPRGGSSKVQFYEAGGPIQQTTFVLHPEWSAGLPEDYLTIRLADLDGDGVCELLGRTSGDTVGHWEVWFYRGGTWTQMANVLPDSSAPDISFADVNNDGHLDLCTPTEVWLNLTPSSVGSSFILPPSSFSLSAFPNPFNAQTRIRFEVARAGEVRLRVFDLLGREVARLSDGQVASGEHEILWDAARFATGEYFTRLDSPEGTRTQKLLLLK